MTRQLDPRISAAVDSYVAVEHHAMVRVMLRNSGLSWSENRTDFLCFFFEKLVAEDPTPFLAFMLGFFTEIKETPDMLDALKTKKRLFF